MGFSSQSGQVIVRSQTTEGIPESDLGTAGVAVRLRSGSIGLDRDTLTLDPEIGGGRDTGNAYLGPGKYAGDYEMYPRFESIGTFLLAGLGSVDTVTTAGLSTHTFTPVDGQLPFMTVYEEISQAFERYLYTDAVVNTLHFEADANGLMQATAGMIARDREIGVADIDGASLFDTTDTGTGSSVLLTYKGIDLKPKSFSWDLANNFEDDDFRLGSFIVADLTAKEREITGSVSIRHKDALLLRQAALGSPTATEIGGLTTKEEMVIELRSYQPISGVTPVTPHSLKFTMPYVMFSPASPSPSGSDVLENDLEFTALRIDPAQPIMTAVLKNGVPEIA